LIQVNEGKHNHPLAGLMIRRKITTTRMSDSRLWVLGMSSFEGGGSMSDDSHEGMVDLQILFPVLVGALFFVVLVISAALQAFGG